MGGNLPAKQEKVVAVKKYLVNYDKFIADVLPRHVTVDQMIRFTLLALNNNPRLLNCTKESILRALMEAGTLGLFPGVLNQAHFVPYGKECAFQIGYGGFITLAMRSGMVSYVAPEVVYEGDDFKWRRGLNPILDLVDTHDPAMVTPDGEHITHVYSIITYKDGNKDPHVMERQKVLAIRDRAPGWIAHVKRQVQTTWLTHAEEMFKAKCLKQHLKRAALSIEVERAVQFDTMQDIGKRFTLIEPDKLPPALEEPPEPTKAERLANETAPGEPSADESKPDDGAPVSKEATELAAQINDEVSARNIGEELFFKWMREIGMNMNADIVLAAPDELTKLLNKCQAFGKREEPTKGSMF